MKKIIFATCLVITCLNAFGQEVSKTGVKEMNKEDKAHKETVKSEKYSLDDYQKFQKETHNRTSHNSKKIAALKGNNAGMNAEAREKYQKHLIALENRNNELDKRMAGFNSNNESDWGAFKNKLRDDLTEVEKGIAHLGSTNKPATAK